MPKDWSQIRLPAQWYLKHSGVVFSNLIPLLGSIFLAWQPLLVILMYAMETIIAGIFNVLKMILVIRNDNEVGKNATTGVIGWGLIPFFLVHYNFFVFIQLTFLFALAGMWGVNIPDGLFNLHDKISYVLSSEVAIGLGAITMGYLIDFIQKYLFDKRHLKMEPGQQMIEVYPRILVQQFVVVLGGWFLLVPHTEYFILALLIVFKTYAEVLIIEKGTTIFQPSSLK